MGNFDTRLRMREHEAKRDYVLVRGTHCFSYYGQDWAGNWELCRDLETAHPIPRDKAQAIVDRYVDSLAYIEPITPQHASHIARCF